MGFRISESEEQKTRGRIRHEWNRLRGILKRIAELERELAAAGRPPETGHIEQPTAVASSRRRKK